MLPGLDGTTALLADFIGAARPTFRFVSAIAYPSNTVLDYSELEALVRATLPTADPFVLLAESFSGPIAMAIASAPPANLVGLVLSTTFASSPVRMLRPLAALLRFAPVRMLPLNILSWWLLGRWATPQLKAALGATLQTVAPEVLRSRAATALRADVSACLQLITVPTLYLRASEDRLLSPAAADAILRALPQAKRIDICAPHLLLQTAYVDAAREIGVFTNALRH